MSRRDAVTRRPASLVPAGGRSQLTSYKSDGTGGRVPRVGPGPVAVACARQPPPQSMRWTDEGRPAPARKAGSAAHSRGPYCLHRCGSPPYPAAKKGGCGACGAVSVARSVALSASLAGEVVTQPPSAATPRHVRAHAAWATREGGCFVRSQVFLIKFVRSAFSPLLCGCPPPPPDVGRRAGRRWHAPLSLPCGWRFPTNSANQGGNLGVSH